MAVAPGGADVVWQHEPMTTQTAGPPTESDLERHRRELTGYCYRMLGSPFDAEDAVQETMIRAWRSRERFEGRSSLRSWLYRIATNVCNDAIGARGRRALPMDMGPAGAPIVENLRVPGEVSWLEPAPTGALVAEGADPADIVEARSTARLAFVVALQHLPPRQRAALILKEAFHWSAQEIADLLETTPASINSALQRARATIDARAGDDRVDGEVDRATLERYVDAFERYDMEALTALIRDDATQGMPPYDLWFAGRDDVLAWWFGPGAACRGSRLLDAGSYNGAPAFAQYKPDDAGDGYVPWALQVVEFRDGRVADIMFFLEPDRLFSAMGLPRRLDAAGDPVPET